MVYVNNDIPFDNDCIATMLNDGDDADEAVLQFNERRRVQETNKRTGGHTSICDLDNGTQNSMRNIDSLDDFGAKSPQARKQEHHALSVGDDVRIEKPKSLLLSPLDLKGGEYAIPITDKSHEEKKSKAKQLKAMGSKANELKSSWGDYKEYRYIIFGGSLLAFNTGFINVVFLVSVFHKSIAYITGNMAASAVAMAEGEFVMFAELAGVWCFFFLGGVMSGVLVHKEQFKIGHAYGRVLLCVSVLLFGSAVGLQNSLKLVAWYPAACAMGMQNAMATTFKLAVIRTTHFTGMTTDLSVQLAHVLTGRAKKSEYWRFMLYIPQLSCFFLGNVVGFFVHKLIQEYTLFIPATLTGVLGITYILNLARVFQHSFYEMLTRDTEGVEDETASWMKNTKNRMQEAVTVVREGVRNGYNEAKASVQSLRYNVDNWVDYTIQRSQHSLRNRRCSSSSSIPNLQSLFKQDGDSSGGSKHNLKTSTLGGAENPGRGAPNHRKGRGHRRSTSMTSGQVSKLDLDYFDLGTGSADLLAKALGMVVKDHNVTHNTISGVSISALGGKFNANSSCDLDEAANRPYSRSEGAKSGSKPDLNQISNTGSQSIDAFIPVEAKKSGHRNKKRNRFNVTTVSNDDLYELGNMDAIPNLCDKQKPPKSNKSTSKQPPPSPKAHAAAKRQVPKSSSIPLNSNSSKNKSNDWDTSGRSVAGHISECSEGEMSTASRTDTPLHNNEAKDRVHRIYYDPLDKRLRERAGSVIDTENEGRRMVPHITLTMPSMDTNMEK